MSPLSDLPFEEYLLNTTVLTQRLMSQNTSTVMCGYPKYNYIDSRDQKSNHAVSAPDVIRQPTIQDHLLSVILLTQKSQPIRISTVTCDYARPFPKYNPTNSRECDSNCPVSAKVSLPSDLQFQNHLMSTTLLT